MNFSWKEHFRDSFQLWDIPNSKRIPRSPNFRHTQTRELLWIGAWYQEDLKRSGAKDEGLCVQKVGGGNGALKVHQRFQDSTALVHSIKTCSKQKDLRKGSRLHADILKTGLLKEDIYVGTALLHMYSKCGMLAKAEEVFDELSARDVASWNALITGYTQHGLGNEALNCFGRMRREGFSPNTITFVCILKACGSIGATEKGKEIHAEVGRQGLVEKNIVLGTAVVDMYAKCGALEKAQEVFDELPVRDVVSWNVLVTGYAQHGLSHKVINCFGRMREEGLSPDAVTFVCILKACGSIRAAEMGEEIHVEVGRQGLLEKNIVLGTALVDMYAKCNALEKAQKVFDQLPSRDVASWNALIAGYTLQGLDDEALNCVGQMQEEGLLPDVVTFVCILKACGSLGAAEKGEEIHAEVGRQGLLEKDIVLGTALVDMYAKCGALAKAQVVFDELPARDVASWTALIAGYAQHQLGDEALFYFGQMRNEGLSPNGVTFACILNACGSIGATEKGEEIHAEVGRHGLLKSSIVLGTALVDMYAKCGALAKAQEVFNELPARDLACWTALMAGYAQHGFSDEALICFDRMQDQGLSPDSAAFLCILKTCGSLGAKEKGEEIHAKAGRQGLEKHVMLGIALVDMYAKCGALAKAQEVFHELPAWDVVSWTALMAGYAQIGMVRRVFDSFSKMIRDGIEPTVITFVVLLNACSHAGLVEEGQMCFDIMSTVYCIIPTLEHYTCMVDLFSRAGLFEKAIGVIEKVQPSDCLLLWLALLGACGKWVNVELGRMAFEHAVQLDERYAAAYVCMNNIYAATGMQEAVHKFEALRMKNGAWEIPGRCWTNVCRNVCLFTVGDMSGQKVLLEGCSPGLHWVSQAISNGGKEDVLCGHTEKLGITFALNNTPEGTPICVTKNMRVCGDCHFAISLISKMEKRKIQVKDANRIHIFKVGKCICEEC